MFAVTDPYVRLIGIEPRTVKALSELAFPKFINVIPDPAVWLPEMDIKVPF